ncbi:MAG: hypothetical protein QOF35_1605 [Actinomycetota bacterium]|nr:hypothetical protein [Actinomycetota bacterium]
MLAIGGMTIVVIIGLAGLCIGGYLVGAHRARAAADLSALSGAAAVAAGGDGCSAARSSANANNAQVVTCDQVGDQVDFVVTVRAEVFVRVRMPGLPMTIGAVAYAGSKPG